MKDKLKAIACLGLAVCVASGLWACSKEDVQTEPESSNTTINILRHGNNIDTFFRTIGLLRSLRNLFKNKVFIFFIIFL